MLAKRLRWCRRTFLPTSSVLPGPACCAVDSVVGLLTPDGGLDEVAEPTDLRGMKDGGGYERGCRVEAGSVRATRAPVLRRGSLDGPRSERWRAIDGSAGSCSG